GGGGRGGGGGGGSRPARKHRRPSRRAAAATRPTGRSWSRRQSARAACSPFRSMPPFPAAQKLLYIVPNLEECHGPDDVGQAGGELGQITVAAGDRRGLRAREEQSQPVRR